MMSPAMAAFKTSFALSPIILTGGIASGILGGMLPILSISNALSFTTGLLGGDDGSFTLDNAFAQFQVLPGGTIIDQKIGMYPFANQSVAANAVIREPIAVSMLMICPVNSSNGYASKLATMMAMQSTLDQHNQAGGTYTIATPSYFYTDMVMLQMSDVSHQDSKQVQTAWKLDFLKPLVTFADAAMAQNAMMSQISNGLPSSGSLQGGGPAIGSPQTLTTPEIAPSSGGAGSSVSGSGGVISV